jgi:hypothetical protein
MTLSAGIGVGNNSSNTGSFCSATEVGELSAEEFPKVVVVEGSDGTATIVDKAASFGRLDPIIFLLVGVKASIFKPSDWSERRTEARGHCTKANAV